MPFIFNQINNLIYLIQFIFQEKLQIGILISNYILKIMLINQHVKQQYSNKTSSQLHQINYKYFFLNQQMNFKYKKQSYVLWTFKKITKQSCKNYNFQMIQIQIMSYQSNKTVQFKYMKKLYSSSLIFQIIKMELKCYVSAQMISYTKWNTSKSSFIIYSQSFLISCLIIKFPQKELIVQKSNKLNEHEDFIIKYDVYIEGGGKINLFYIQKQDRFTQKMNSSQSLQFQLSKERSSNVEFKAKKQYIIAQTSQFMFQLTSQIIFITFYSSQFNNNMKIIINFIECEIGIYLYLSFCFFNQQLTTQPIHFFQLLFGYNNKRSIFQKVIKMIEKITIIVVCFNKQ
ncbi:unnamed protein product (macronuclear) [Paramecium tetraurelia]|uniref:Transmembrane protein n=1 Tax=Paramecium tetraurelia TaxID=5888 RepID=A0BX36_PARTE|nr:uncharacterized protein GSPATT00032955001 [Paramecium tetraurelia]CAK63103.1 unnamed protein product [Paramecium tetraurelia]|eukprot:XP_001430501.1 hypothetical protein (macronuclear) [Paramecium tetraurelia strain d4-2]